jgi:hypothetical protein
MKKVVLLFSVLKFMTLGTLPSNCEKEEALSLP